MKTLILSTAALIASGAMAVAGGPVATPAEAPLIAVQPAPQVALGNWQGVSVGANLNWGKSKASGLVGRPDGVGLGLRSNFDWQFDRMVLGFGSDLDFGKTKGTFGGVATEIGRTGTIFAKAGYDAGQWMPYALAGYSKAKLTTGGASSSMEGYTLGLGAEYRLSQAVSTYAEYSYSNFGNVAALGNAKVDTQKLRMGMNFRF
jgi:outer membrane immunogenic protein